MGDENLLMGDPIMRLNSTLLYDIKEGALNSKSGPSLKELNQQVMSCMKKGDVQGALEKTEMIIDHLPENDEVAKAKFIANQGFLQARMQKLSDALESFQNASHLFQENGYLIGMAIQTGNIGSIYRDQKNYSEAIKYYQQALQDLQEQNYQNGIADQHSNLAYAYSQQSDIDAAILHFEKAAEIYETLGIDDKACQCRDNLKILITNR